MNAKLRLQRTIKIAFIVLIPFIVLPLLILPVHYLAEYVLGEGKGVPWIAGLMRYEIMAVIALPVLLLAVYLAMRRLAINVQKIADQSIGENGATYVILPRSDADDIDPGKIVLWNTMSTSIKPGEHISFELSSTDKMTCFAIRANKDRINTYLGHLKTVFNGTRAKPFSKVGADPLIAHESEAGWWCVVAPANSRSYPIVSEVGNPVHGMLSAMAGGIPSGVRCGMQVLVRRDQMTQKELLRQASKVTAEGVRGKSTNQKDTEKSMDNRSRRNFLEVRVLTWAIAPNNDANTAQSVAMMLANTLEAQFNDYPNPMKVVRSGKGTLANRWYPIFTGDPMTDQEISYFANLPGKSAWKYSPQLMRAPANPLPPTSDCLVTAADEVAQFKF